MPLEKKFSVMGYKRVKKGNPALSEADLIPISSASPEVRELKVMTFFQEELGVQYASTSILFAGGLYSLRYMRSEPCGEDKDKLRLIVAIEKYQGPYDVMELYTDHVLSREEAKQAS